jgi:hypothetical protein
MADSFYPLNNGSVVHNDSGVILPPKSYLSIVDIVIDDKTEAERISEGFYGKFRAA